jgi:succinoglycan biosynthesis protein ExoA
MIHLSVIIPVRNEAAHIAEVLDRLLEQNYEPDKWEILVVDGMSEDQTPQIVQKYVQEHPLKIRYFENPKRLASAARNVGIQNAQGDAVLIVDGHCIIDNNDMLRNVSEAFDRSGADCLGRPQPLEMKDASALQWAIAAARRSPLGHHPDSFIYSGQAQFSPASSVAVAYRMSVFEKVGTFDESFDAAEDVELNTRIDAAELKCYFEPTIAVRYVPRNTLKGLSVQMNRYGRGRVRLWRKHQHTFSWKSFAPGLFVLGYYLALLYMIAYGVNLLTIIGSFGLAGSKSFADAGIMVIWILLAIVCLYVVVLYIESVRLSLQQKRMDILSLLPKVFGTIHFGYGGGVLREFLFPRRKQAK